MMRDLGRICLPADLSNLGKLKDFLKAQLVLLDFSYEQSLKIELACDEVITNVIGYAYPELVGDVGMHCETSDGETLFVRITDQVKEYNPLDVTPPDLGLGLDERQIGGLGLLFVQEMADDIAYERVENSNVLTLTFHKHDSGPS